MPYYQPKFELQKRTWRDLKPSRVGTPILAACWRLGVPGSAENEELASILTAVHAHSNGATPGAGRTLVQLCSRHQASASDFLNPDFARDFLRIVSDSIAPRDFVLESQNESYWKSMISVFMIP